MGVMLFITDNLEGKTSLPLDRSGGAKTSTYPPSLAFRLIHLAGRQRELPGNSLPVAIRASSYMVIGANLLPPWLPLAEQHTHQYLD